MKLNSRWGRLWLLTLALALCFIANAQAAPDRLNDSVPDAFLDEEGTISFTYSHEALNLEGPLSDNTIGHDYFKLRYTLNPKTAVSFRYGSHNLNGGLGLVNPVFDNRDGGESYKLDLRLNLLSVPAVPADPDNKKEFEAGSAFDVGVSGTYYQMDMGDLASNDSLLRAYLLYTTDLSPEMRAHTIFTTSRLSGDSSSGSVNRIGAGLDYALIDGNHPLTLLANGVLDVYNFRQPDFNTSRVSSFDVGLRYRVARSWYASLGYTTYNDSENDVGGSGIFASVQFLDEPKPCVVCEAPPEEAAQPQAQQQQPDPPPAPAPPAAASQNPPPKAATQAPLMKSASQQADKQPAADAKTAEAPAEKPPAEGKEAPAQDGGEGEATPPAQKEEAGVDKKEQPEPPPASEVDQSAPADDATAADGEQPEAPATETEDSAPETPPAPEEAKAAASAAPGELGIQIPALAEDRPHQTPAGAVMVRAAGSVVSGKPHQTSPNDVMLRAPANAADAEGGDELATAETGTVELADKSALLAMSSAAAASPDGPSKPADDSSATADDKGQGTKTDQSKKAAASQDG